MAPAMGCNLQREQVVRGKREKMEAYSNSAEQRLCFTSMFEIFWSTRPPMSHHLFWPTAGAQSLVNGV